MRYFWLLGLVVVLFACDTNRVYETNTDLADEQWTKDQIVSFDFDIEDANQAYNLYANIRNAQHYPYHNLYYQYELRDSVGTGLKKELQNIILFEPKTGEPFGEGLGDIFDHRQLLLEQFKFPAPGSYSMSLQQYMRNDTLPLIMSVGVRVEKAATE